MIVSIICPVDRHALEEAAAGLCCGLCGRTFPIQNGVICTLGRLDDFYEGAYESETRFLPRSERPWHVWPLWLINSGYLWTVRRFVPQGATVVELGCAAGVRYFGQRYRMVGCDLSLSSLARLQDYECRVQADAKVCIPLPSNSVDAVISSYFWEHIPPEAKPLVLSEAKRILRPGGKVIFLYDVKTQNPLIKKYQEQDPDQYDWLSSRVTGISDTSFPARISMHSRRRAFRWFCTAALKRPGSNRPRPIPSWRSSGLVRPGSLDGYRDGAAANLLFLYCADAAD